MENAARSSLAICIMGSGAEGGASPTPAAEKRLWGLLRLDPGDSGEFGAEDSPCGDAAESFFWLPPLPGLGLCSAVPPAVARLLPLPEADGSGADVALRDGSSLKDTRLSARAALVGSGAEGAAAVPEMRRWLLLRTSCPEGGSSGCGSGNLLVLLPKPKAGALEASPVRLLRLLAGWLGARLAGWLGARLAGWLGARLPGWLGARLAGALGARLAGALGGLLAGLLPGFPLPILGRPGCSPALLAALLGALLVTALPGLLRPVGGRPRRPLLGALLGDLLLAAPAAAVAEDAARLLALGVLLAGLGAAVLACELPWCWLDCEARRRAFEAAPTDLVSRVRVDATAALLPPALLL